MSGNDDVAAVIPADKFTAKTLTIIIKMKQLLLYILISISSYAIAQKSDSTYFLNFNINAKPLIDGGFELQNKKLIKEFILTGKNNNKYSIEILNDSNSVILQSVNGLWKSVDTLSHGYFITDTNILLVPSFCIVDFNNDGNQDLLCWTMTNINGNQWTEIYLNNTKTLVKLENTADGIWAAPKYHKKNNIITCEEVSGNFGVFYKSKYKLDGFKAVPIKKYEIDNTNMDSNTGKGGIINKYIGENNKWKLIKTKNNNG